MEEIVKKLNQSIEMGTDEKQLRMKEAQKYIDTNSTLKWSAVFLKDLKRASLNNENAKYMVIGLGLGLTFIKTRPGFSELNSSILEYEYQRSINRLIIVDLEGSVPIENGQPIPQVIQALQNIS